MAELADALDLGSSVFDVGVQVPSSAPKQPTYLMVCRLFFVIGRDLNPKRAFDVKQNSPVNCFVVKRCADGYRSQRLGSASKKGAQQPCPFIFKNKSIFAFARFLWKGLSTAKTIHRIVFASFRLHPHQNNLHTIRYVGCFLL